MLLINGLRDPRIGFVTITGVEVSPDLHLAKVFYSVVGDEKVKQDTAAGLKSSLPFIRKHLGSCLKLRYTPDLLFEYDGSVEYGNRIENLLREVRKDSADD